MATFIMISLAFFLEHNTKPHELVENVITDEFLETCVATTIAQGEDDEEFTRRVRVCTSKRVPYARMEFIAFRIQT